MSGFNLAELLPFYLDETDEHITALNTSLLRLEQDPTDVKALQEAFRMFHSIKGASVVMGFKPVNQLTHHLESLFEELRSKKRELDRSILDLTFQCLDELRDYHRDLRSHGQSTVDLSGRTNQVVDFLRSGEVGGDKLTREMLAPAPRVPDPPHQNPVSKPIERPGLSSTGGAFDEPGVIALVLIFQPNLPLADMKARLVLNRLSSRARILSTEPPLEQLDNIDVLSRFTVYLTAEVSSDELRNLADVEGIAKIEVTSLTSDGSVKVLAETAEDPHAPLSPQRAHGPLAQSISDKTPSLLESALKPVSTSDEPAAVKLPGIPGKAKVAETIRVESDRLDHLMNLAGELVITKARFVAIARDLDELFRGSNAHVLTSDTRERLESLTRGLEGLVEIKSGSTAGLLDRWSVHVRQLRDNFRAIQDELDLIRQARERLKSLTETIHSLGRVSDGLQKGVLDTRMVPIGPLFERFRRVIRDLSLSSAKEVTLQINGEKTELDKRMIDELSDPLIHMVRNSVDHGLEPPGEREAIGKPRAGMVSLTASHRGNSILITVSDDGRGIDCERIRHKIVANGLVSKSEAHELADRELIAFIWHPGLSTAEVITDISGRGVGMDIVKSRIENLSGTVDVRSTPGHGTTFAVRLPLTLAIMSSLLVRIYDEIYAIPLDHIDEIVEVRPSQLYHVQGRPAIEIRKKIIALVGLGDIFHWGGRVHPSSRNGIKPSHLNSQPGDEQPAKRIVVVVQNGETTIGLLVDQLIGMQEVVLKSLEKNFRAIPGLSGASILGDGRVSLILDLDAVLDMVARQSTHRREDNSTMTVTK